MDECIYCGVPFDSQKGQGDHVIPCQFGEFRKDVRFRRICPTCNSEVGKSEQQLLQCAPEAWFRRVVRPAVPRRRRRGGTLVGAHGMPPPQNTVQLSDHSILVETDRDDLDLVRQVDQIVLQAANGIEDHLRLFPQMNVTSIRRKIERSKVKKPAHMWLHCDKSREPYYKSLVVSALPSCSIESLPDTEPGLHKVKGLIKFNVRGRYFQAIAKIGFHYYLCHTRRGYKGNEDIFAPLRQFILHGGDKDSFVSEGNFGIEGIRACWLKEILAPSGWHHILALDETTDSVIAYIHLFRGPQSNFPGFRVRVGSQNSRIEIPSFRCAHVFAYDEIQDEHGQNAGEVHLMP